jgi:hypothetical protein
MNTNPWEFGWTQLLTLIGFAMTLGIAGLGFRSFERWRREKLEEKKIEVALEALALAHESKYVFQTIRSPVSYDHEWKDAPRWQDESEEDWRRRGPYAAILLRLDRHKEFFERLFKLQPRLMAMLGSDKEDIFPKCHQARRYIEVSAGMMMREVVDRGPRNEDKSKLSNQFRADLWEGWDAVEPGIDRVSRLLGEFQQGIIQLCEPIAAPPKRRRLFLFG